MEDMSKEEKKVNYDYYEPRCIHESSLSPSVHAILASELGYDRQAEDFSSFATRMDLDNYNRNTCEGLHTTSIAAAWMNIVFGFGGFRCDGDEFSFSPKCPKRWKGYSFRLAIRDCVVFVRVSGEDAEFTLLSGDELTVSIYGKQVTLGKDTLKLKAA